MLRPGLSRLPSDRSRTTLSQGEAPGVLGRHYLAIEDFNEARTSFENMAESTKWQDELDYARRMAHVSRAAQDDLLPVKTETSAPELSGAQSEPDGMRTGGNR